MQDKYHAHRAKVYGVAFTDLALRAPQHQLLARVLITSGHSSLPGLAGLVDYDVLAHTPGRVIDSRAHLA